MPIYDYTCAACGHLIEVVHGIHDHGPRFCPECGAEGTMVKAIAAPTIHFKGSGWAKKDRSASSKPPSKPKSDDPKGGSEPAATTGSAGDGSSSSGGSSSTPATD